MVHRAPALTTQQAITEAAKHLNSVARRSISTAAIELLTHLIAGPRDVTALTRCTCLDIATVSKRLSALRGVGLVTREIVGSRHIYALADTVRVITLGEHRLLVMQTPGGIFALGIAQSLVEHLAQAG